MAGKTQRRLRRLYVDAWTRAKPAFRVQTANGTAMRIPAAYRSAAALADWAPNWKSHLIEAVLAVRPGAFLDVGANIGQTLVDFHASGLARPYVAFEPNTRCVEILRDLVSVNGLPGCQIVPAGLSNANGIVRLLLKPGSDTDSGASIDDGLRPGRNWEERLVPCFRLDDIRERLGIRDIGFVKIDVEGAELAALEGMKATIAGATPWIACEVLHRDRNLSTEAHQARLDRLEAFLGGLGYAALQIRKTADGKKVAGVTPMESFPNEVFSERNESDCDYLFVPRPHAPAAASMNWR